MKTFIFVFFLFGAGVQPSINKALVRRQVIFPDINTNTSTRIPPANPEITTVYRVPCSCPFTSQYAPVCGSDGQSYGNIEIFNCARFCGSSKYKPSNVTLVYTTACGNNRG